MEEETGTTQVSETSASDASAATPPVETQAPPRPIGKQRSPMIVILLMIVTLGIYGIVYHYCTFEELRNRRGQGWSGGVFLIFLFLFPFPLVALPWLVPAYVGRMYAEEGQEKPITGLAGFWQLLPLIGNIIWIFRVQNCMNRFWQLKSPV